MRDMTKFKLVSKFEPMGDQPAAIRQLTEGILRQAVTLSERYITDRFLPDKAIDLIDEACSDLNLKDKNISRRMEIQRELDDYEKERNLIEERRAQGQEPDWERFAFLKSQALKLQSELDSIAQLSA